jgi:hypothetical protein
MKFLKHLAGSAPALALAAFWPPLLPADTSNGPDPYASGFGFDRPEEAEWGGWKRGDAGSLHAEWDVFSDKSHGGAADRTAAPDLGSSGTSSAWLGWNAGTFVSGTGNLYSFTVPEAFNINMAGALAPASLRVVLQVETQGRLLDTDTFRLNDSKPAAVSEAYRDKAFPSPLGPTDLVHTRLIWDLASAPENSVFVFKSAQPHVSLTQVAVDIGPLPGAAEPVPTPPPDPAPVPAPTPTPDPTPVPGGPSVDADRTVLAKLPAEDLAPDLAADLHAQYPRWFPEVWDDQVLTFRQQSAQGGRLVRFSLKGGVKALYHRQGSGAAPSNEVYVDLYRPAQAGDVKLAECRLEPTQKRRWKTVSWSGQPLRLGTAVYRLELAAAQQKESPQKVRLKKRLGACSVVSAIDHAGGIPALQEGDFGVFRREPG